MQTVNSVSGGKTSCYMAIHHPADINIFACVCIDDPRCAPKDPTVRNYCIQKLNGNFIASAEHEKTLKVMMQLEQLLGKEVVWVRGKSFDQVIQQHRCLPSKVMRFCTTEMKIIPIFEYCYSRYGIVNMQIGFRADDDIERIERAKNNRKIKYPVSCKNFGEYKQNLEEITWRENSFPLYRTFHFQIVKYWKSEHPEFDFPDDSNCRGCPYKPKLLIKKNWQETPEHLEWFARQENLTGYAWHPGKGKGRSSYEKTFKMNFTEEIHFLTTDANGLLHTTEEDLFTNFTMCNSGGCTD